MTYLIPSLDDREWVQHETHSDPGARACEEIPLRSQLRKGRGGLRRGGCAERREVRGSGEKCSELVEAREVQCDPRDIPEQ